MREGFGLPKNLACGHYARHIAIVLRIRHAAGRGWKGKGGEGKTESVKRGRNEEKGMGGKLEQGRRLAKAGPGRNRILFASTLVSLNCFVRGEVTYFEFRDVGSTCMTAKTRVFAGSPIKKS